MVFIDRLVQIRDERQDSQDVSEHESCDHAVIVKEVAMTGGGSERTPCAATPSEGHESVLEARAKPR
jgi:hypothetical protein